MNYMRSDESLCRNTHHVKGVRNKRQGVNCIAYKESQSKPESEDRMFPDLPTMSSSRKKALSMARRRMIRFDFERPMVRGAAGRFSFARSAQHSLMERSDLAGRWIEEQKPPESREIAVSGLWIDASVGGRSVFSSVVGGNDDVMNLESLSEAGSAEFGHPKLRSRKLVGGSMSCQNAAVYDVPSSLCISRMAFRPPIYLADFMLRSMKIVDPSHMPL